MVILTFILLLLALLCFAAAAFGASLHPRVELLALGLLFWVAVPFIHACQRL